MTFTYEDAVALAREGHADQVDLSGAPYIGHVLRVAYFVTATGADEHTRIAAVLHDYVEDVTEGDFGPLREAGVPEESLVMIDAVTRRADPSTPSGKEPYQGGLIGRAARHDGSRLIKLMDNGDNTLPRRVALLGPQQESMSATRYTPARIALLAAEQARRAEGLDRDFPTDPDAFLAFVRDLDARWQATRD